MVVADEDPPRKRSKLSLKSSRKGESTPPLDEPPPLEAAEAAPQGPIIRPKTEPTTEDCPPVLDLSQSDLPCDSYGVPPVASLENLGNTCFLNSVLEVLRYTPCFLEGLGELYRHIIYLEKVQTAASSKSGSETKPETNLSWELVKNIYKTYKMMEKKEQMFHQLASVDVISMSVKPDKILDDIRYFNPMFEGNMQHDAQELLRCLLCYLEDAEKELHDAYTTILAMDPSLLKILPVCEKARLVKQNPIMEKFLEKGKGRWSRSSATGVKQEEFVMDPSAGTSGADCSVDGEQLPLLNQQDGGNRESVRENLEGHASTKWCNKAETETKILPSKRTVDEAGGNVKDAMKSGWNTKAPANCSGPKRQKVGEEKSSSAEETLSQNEVVSFDSVSSSGHIPTEKKTECTAHKEKDADRSGPGLERTRRSPRQSLGNVRAKCQGSSRNTSRVSPKPSNKNCDATATDDSCPEKSKTTRVMSCDKKYQPTIQLLFEKKRLGMRGAVASRGLAGGESSCRNKTDASLEPTSDSVAMSLQKENCNSSDIISKHCCKQESQPEMCNGEDDAKKAVTSTSDNSNCQAGLSSQINSPMTTNKIASKSAPPNNMRSVQVVGSEHLPQNSAGADVTDGEERSKVTDKDRQHPDSWEAVCTNSQCSPVSSSETNPAVVLQSGTPRSELPRCSEQCDKALESPSGKTKTSSPAASIAGVGVSEKVMGLLQPGKLMIKLEKCDHVCNSPSISASAALKALQTPSSACRRVDFNKSQNCSVGPDSVDSDHEEDEPSLGTMGSFKSVPLKSVCIKVEKCDMVCNSPDKSVNAQFAATCLARQRAQRFNIIEKLFQGTMVMQTKCLECERCTERKESFQDISVPLKREQSNEADCESDEERDSSLLSLMHAFTDVEHLRDDNKYFCDHCLRYVEAERSLHYEALPNILTVHLKRFSATTGMFGCLSKINDHVTVPLQLSCLHYKCPECCSRPDHRYTLFAIIMHAGSTITSGHYLSYIKVRPNADGPPLAYDTLINYLNNSPVKKKGSVDGQALMPEHTQGRKVAETPCPLGDASSGSSDEEAAGGDHDSNRPEYHWLECDDETIRILSEKEFKERLLDKEVSLRGTPYVLFYHRLDTWRGR